MFEEGAAAVLKRVVAGITIVVAAIGGAQAQDAPRDGFYLRAGAGVSLVDDLEQSISYSPNRSSCLAIGCNPNRKVTNLETGYVASAAIGFNYLDGIRTELEYRYAATGIESIERFEGASGAFSNPQGENDTLGAHFILSNVYFDLPTDGPISPFIGLGVGGAFVSNENGETDAALAYQGRAGLSWRLSADLNMDMEYIYLRTNDLVYDMNDPAIEGLDDAPYQSSSVMLSIRKQF